MPADIIEGVALVTGRLIHEGTGKAVVGRVRIAEPKEIAARAGLLTDKMLADGTFVVSGRVESLFPKLNSQKYRLKLIIRADSRQFRKGFAEHTLMVEIPKDATFDPPIDVGAISLPADPVNIRGRVVQARNPEKPIPGATVGVLHSGPQALPPVNTDANGRYRILNVTVLAPTKIRCSAPGFKTQERALLIDFSRLINEEHFRLAP